jgi:hypothetical protein
MPKEEQQQIPGTETPKIKAIEKVAEAYQDSKDAFQKASAKVQEWKTKLIAVCREHEGEMSVDGEGNRLYKYDDLVVTFSHKDGVKVKTAKEEDPDAD